jgi:histidyl-tRNA synthetase
MPAVISAVFRRLAFGDFRIRVNNRKVLEGLLRGSSDVVTDSMVAAGMVAIDENTDPDRIEYVLKELGFAKAGLLLAVLTQPMPDADILPELNSLARSLGSTLALDGLDELSEVMARTRDLGVTECVIDPMIARGLSYYTGTVYETSLVDFPEVGSICSGGRYDNLTGAFTKERFPGVGISIGLSRLAARLFEFGIWGGGPSTPASCLVVNEEGCGLVASSLRAAGIKTEVYTGTGNRKKQFEYARKKGFRYCVIPAPEGLTYRDLNVGENDFTVSISEFVSRL